MRLSAALVVVLSLFSAACHVEVGSKKKDESYGYDFTVNGCNTGNHRFNSVSELCAGLSNDALNNFCAGGPRYDMAKAHGCPQVSAYDSANM